MFDDIQIGVSTHAIRRFRQRIDPTAQPRNMIEYLKQGEISTYAHNTMRKYGYNLCQYLTMESAVYVKYLHVTFVVCRKKGKGAKQVCIVTCF